MSMNLPKRIHDNFFSPQEIPLTSSGACTEATVILSVVGPISSIMIDGTDEEIVASGTTGFGV